MHMHVLVWLQHVAAADLPSVISATVPQDDVRLTGCVLASQVDREGESRWPVREEPSRWNALAGRLELQHTQEDRDLGL